MKLNSFEIPQNELVDVIKASKGAFYYAALVSCFINLLMLTPSLYMLQIYDRVLASRSHETLLMLTLVVAIFLV